MLIDGAAVSFDGRLVVAAFDKLLPDGFRGTETQRD